MPKIYYLYKKSVEREEVKSILTLIKICKINFFFSFVHFNFKNIFVTTYIIEKFKINKTNKCPEGKF